MTPRNIYPVRQWVVWVFLLPVAFIVLGFAIFATTDSQTLLFDHPHLWWLGAAGPLAGLLLLFGVLRRRHNLERFTSAQLAPLLAARVSPARKILRASLLGVSVLMVAAGVIGPRWGLYLEKQQVHGVDVVVAIDVSRSMLARDVEPNRMERAKREIRQQLVERAVFRRANRLALLAFAGSTSLKLPLTTDHLSFRSKLETIDVGSAPRGGTAIAAAIRGARDLFAKSTQEATKIIVLFTDGEDHEGDPLEEAKLAYEQAGIRTFTVGVGDTARTVGAQVPSGAGASSKPILYDGQIVFSKLDVANLQRIALAGGGQFASIKDFHRLVSEMAKMRSTELTTEERIRHRPRYQWFVAAALILLALETIISERRASVTKLPQRVWQQEFAT